PRLTAVDCFPDPAFARARLNAGIAPFAPDALPHRRVQRVRVGRGDDDTDRARPRAAVEHLLPYPATVDSLEDAAVLVIRPFMAGRCHVNDVGVRGMDENAGDGLRVGEPHVRERTS